VATVLLPPSPASSVDTIKALECGSITHPILIYISAVGIGMFLPAGLSQGVRRLGTSAYRFGINGALLEGGLKFIIYSSGN
jgi:hypothetical protein